MALIKGGQVGVIRRILKTGIDAATAITQIDLDNISQTLPIVPEILRRSAPLAGIDGWFTGVLENVHSGADEEDSTVFPYEVTRANVLGNFPTPIPEGWDIHLVSCGGVRTSGAGGITGSTLLDTPASVQGFALDDAGNPIGLSPRAMILGMITGFDATAGALTNDPIVWAGVPGLTQLRVGLRIPRGAALHFFSTSDAAVTAQMTFLMGLFPLAMGQDVGF